MVYFLLPETVDYFINFLKHYVITFKGDLAKLLIFF